MMTTMTATQRQLIDLMSLQRWSDDFDNRYMGTAGALAFASDFTNREAQAWALTRIAELLGWDTESGFCFSKVIIGRYSLWRIAAPDRAFSFGPDAGIEGLMEMKRSDAIAAILLHLENKK